MNVLIACEESQEVCKAFREKGHDAFSCDILECSGGHPEWHIKSDVIPLIDGYCAFYTQDNKLQRIDKKWDLIIAHPPCTYLTVTGNRWFNIEKYGNKAKNRITKRLMAANFFMQFINADCKRIAVENPIGCMSTYYKKPDQIIHPWMFALSEEEKTEKNTCLWLKGLPMLQPLYTEKPVIPYKEWTSSNGRHKRQTLWYYNTRCLPHADRAKAASRTFKGIAKAMAEQWG